jgi:hypothetical protein
LEFEPHSAELFFRVVQTPALELFFQFLVDLIKLKRKKLLFVLYKGKLLYLVKYFLPHILNIHLKLELSPIFESNIDLHVVLAIDVTMKFLYFGQGKRLDLEPPINNVQLIVGCNQLDLFVFTCGRFVVYTL